METSGSNGGLPGLLKYRFTKKSVPKISSSLSTSEDSQESNGAQDSQATIPYNANSQSASFSQQSTQSPSYSSQLITDKPSSPVLGSRLSLQNHAGGFSHTNGTSASASATLKPKPTVIDTAALERLKERFPNGNENRMRAALIVYPEDFNRAVEFMNSEPIANSPTPSQNKRPASDSGDELPEITKQRKRIKLMAESPPPDAIVISNEEENPMEFLCGCFPSKSEEHIQRVLNENGGNTDLTLTALQNEDSKDAEIASRLAGPSSSGFINKQNPPPSVVTLAGTIKKTATKVKAKKRTDDLSDEDEDFSDYDSDGDSDDSEDLDNRGKSEKDNFLQFFEEASIEELTALPGCSKKKAEMIISIRPFETWDNLYEKFSTEKTLSTSVISGCKEIMQVRNTIRRLMMRCESISEQMGKVVSRLTSGQYDGELSSFRISKQPDLLNKDFTLKPYQLIGLSWLRIMHEQQLNGILADEMGLGKTIQAISFLAHLMELGEEGPHVIIVPSSTIENWLRELQMWCPALKVVVYYGSQDERRAVRHSIFYDGEDFNVLLTTYNMATGGVEDRVLFKKFEFHYAVFDEGHMLKNMSSLRFQNLMKISADRRLLLTGTPLQNNLLELMSLLCFVMPEIFQGKTDHLKKVFAMITRSEDAKKSRFEKNRIAQAKRIMKPFVLRRLKKDVLSQLPEKKERIVKCPMVPCQQRLYDGLLNKFSEMTEDGGDNQSSGGLSAFMQLRKAANHPLLLRNIYSDEKLAKMSKEIAKEPSHRDRGALPHLIQEDMAVLNDFDIHGLCKQYKKYLKKFLLDISTIIDSGKFKMLDKLLPEMKQKDDRVLLFSQFTMMLDVIEIYMEARNHKYLRLDGSTPVTERLQLIDKFNNEPDIFIFLLSTRAGGLGINLTAANTIILHDIDFNPYNDKQAEDRCHRLGQKRDVHVVKLISEETVDEAMLKCANQKLDLEKDLTETTNEESEENVKDVAKLLKEALKSRQKKKELTSPSVSNGESLEADGTTKTHEDDLSL